MNNIMKSLIGIATILLIFSGCGNMKQHQEADSLKIQKFDMAYPSVFRDTTVVDDYHGVLVKDPYRWLEDPDSEETKNWVTAQNELTFNHLKKIPYREAIRERLSNLWNYERYSAPFKEGGKYYYFKNDGLQNQSVLYAQDEPGGESTLVLDPNQFSTDGTASLAGYSFSNDGRYLAYQVSTGGSDWRTAYVKDLQTGKVMEDKLEWLKFTGTPWYGNGFFYSRYPAPAPGEAALSAKNEFQQVYFHELGTPQSADKLIFEDADSPRRGFSSQITEDQRFLILNVWESTSGNALYVKDLQDEKGDFVTLIGDIEDDYYVIDNIGAKLLVLTNHGAPNQRLMAVDLKKPEFDNWETIIPETEDVLEGVYLAGGKLIAKYLHDAYSVAKAYTPEGTYIGEVSLPGIGSVGSFSGRMDDRNAFYSYTSFTHPSTIYQLDMESLESTLYHAPSLDFDMDAYVTKQVWYDSKDGTRVPMFVTHKKDIELDGKRPTLLYGYGGFNVKLTPSFSLTRTVILENGGVFAMPNLRGGGEFGAEWHKAGTLERKQNVFDDFIAAAEYLIENGYTTAEKLAIQGGSNGGLLIGACMTQRPELFGVALPAVGVLDMLRYHLFTIGAAWATDYGLSTDSSAFHYLKAYSPLHNVKEIAYPATLVTTADHDDRVVPAHSFKFISTLQHHHNGDSPVLIRVETSAGHGAGKPVSKQIEEAADWIGFMFYHLKQDVKYDYGGNQ